MAGTEPPIDYNDVESRRNKHSGRRMTRGRRLAYAIGRPITEALLYLLNASYRTRIIKGEDVVERLISNNDEVYISCYWHRYHLVCAYLARQWLRRDFKACFIVSASVDGDVPARIARSWGAEVIRGSAAQTGSLVLRDAQQMLKRGVSIFDTSDGPLGPRCEFKTGTVLLARIGGALLVPIGCAADRAWYLDTWDRFMIPKPFARVAIAIGKPIAVPRTTSMTDMEPLRATMQAAIESLVQDSEAAVTDAT
jgi:lysophospholipid acyltransferase (LPLAT)-like uncharacterized protein